MRMSAGPWSRQRRCEHIPPAAWEGQKSRSGADRCNLPLLPPSGFCGWFSSAAWHCGSPAFFESSEVLPKIILGAETRFVREWQRWRASWTWHSGARIQSFGDAHRANGHLLFLIRSKKSIKWRRAMLSSPMWTGMIQIKWKRFLIWGSGPAQCGQSLQI